MINICQILVNSYLKKTTEHFLFVCLCILHFGPSQILIYSLNFGNDVSDFIFSRKLFQIFRPKDHKLWVPNVLVFIRLAMISFCLTFAFSLGLNIFFM